MKTDVLSRDDIEKIVGSFYDKVKSDEVIGFFFSRVVEIDWNRHLPLMCAFWENILFYTGEYEGDPLAAHLNISRKYPTSSEHFERWLQLFAQSVDELYQGENAEKMKRHARGISTVMQGKITQSQIPGSKLR